MSKAEIQYFIMFAAGIAVFWLGGFAVSYLPLVHNQLIAHSEGLVTTLAIYTLGFIILLLFMLGRRRNLKAIIVAALTVIVLALIGAQLLVHFSNGRIHNQVDLGLLTFASYLLYGVFYVLGNTIGQRISASRA